jgi:uncharacterized membrane protein YhdT
VSLLPAFSILVQYLADWTVWGFNPRPARGWTSLILVSLSCAALQLFFNGVLGEYLGRLFEESKRRPLYLVRKRINIERPASLPW